MRNYWSELGNGLYRSIRDLETQQTEVRKIEVTMLEEMSLVNYGLESPSYVHLVKLHDGLENLDETYE